MAKAKQGGMESHIVVTQKPYEIVIVFKPDLLQASLEKKLKEFEAFLEENNGRSTLRDIWGRRDLAYPIRQHTQGLYVVYNASLSTDSLKELDEHLRIHTDVIRHLVVSLPEGYTYNNFQQEAAEPEKAASAKPQGLDDKLEKILNNDEFKL